MKTNRLVYETTPLVLVSLINRLVIDNIIWTALINEALGLPHIGILKGIL
jgi:hypothetical protein